MVRTSMIGVALGVAILRQPACTCVEAEPCEYLETPLATDERTPWDTVVADDIALLEQPQPGTWRWYSSGDDIAIADADMVFPAIARFTHDPEGVTYREHIDGGEQTACYGPTVRIKGQLTFTNEADEIIVSVPVTAERALTASLQYDALETFVPIDEFSPDIEALREYDVMQIVGLVNWYDNERLRAEFNYRTQTKNDSGSGYGVILGVALFEADPE